MEARVSIEVAVVHDCWLAACPDAAALAEAAARAALRGRAARDAGGPLVVEVVLTDDAAQRQLNRTWRGIDASTNVLAFAIGDPGATPADAPLLLGDIVLAFETVTREAAEQGKPLADHISHMVVHGTLHLLGFDHASDTEAGLMEGEETEILAGLGVPNPYRDTM